MDTLALCIIKYNKKTIGHIENNFIGLFSSIIITCCLAFLIFIQYFLTSLYCQKTNYLLAYAATLHPQYR